MELFQFDERLRVHPQDILAGTDEVGRGPLAGPVVAAAVVFIKKSPVPGLNDSKKVSPKMRQFLFRKIILQALIGIGKVSESVIDEMNILEATRLAMREAVLALPCTPNLLLIDGNIRLDLPIRQMSIVRGDAQSATIAAASIVAKVYRDSVMDELDKTYPAYGFSLHKGYPTQLHLAALKQNGASPIHRKSFRPVAETLLGVSL